MHLELRCLALMMELQNRQLCKSEELCPLNSKSSAAEDIPQAILDKIQKIQHIPPSLFFQCHKHNHIYSFHISLIWLLVEAIVDYRHSIFWDSLYSGLSRYLCDML